jgi:type IV secretory pathway component VirB8
MSSQKDDIIAQKLEGGTYFKDAREWYAEKYLYPIKERSFYLVTCLLACYTFAVIAFTAKNLNSVDLETPFTVYTDNATDYFSLISPLIKDGEAPQEAIAKHLVIDYLKTREEYFHVNMKGNNLKRILKKIKISSSKEVYGGYQSYMNKTNPYSPFIRYRDHTNRSIRIKDFKFTSGDLTNGKVEILFEATEEYTYKSQKNLWRAFINFRLPNVEVISQSGVPLRFVVTHYKVKLEES